MVVVIGDGYLIPLPFVLLLGQSEGINYLTYLIKYVHCLLKLSFEIIISDDSVGKSFGIPINFSRQKIQIKGTNKYLKKYSVTKCI